MKCDITIKQSKASLCMQLWENVYYLLWGEKKQITEQYA